MTIISFILILAGLLILLSQSSYAKISGSMYGYRDQMTLSRLRPLQKKADLLHCMHHSAHALCGLLMMVAAITLLIPSLNVSVVAVSACAWAILAADAIVFIANRHKQNFTLPKGFDPKETFRKLFGVILDNGPVENVVIKVSDEQVKYYRTLPMHHSQEEGVSKDRYTEFSYRLVPTYDFVHELLSKGDTIEVMSPAWLRHEVAKELRRAASMYDDVPNEE